MGTVKFFKMMKERGLIAPETSADVSVLVFAVQKAGNTRLVEGALVSYELASDGDGRLSAENLRFG